MSSSLKLQDRLLILDGHAYAYRAFHAIRALNAPSGNPTNAIFGFIKSFEKLLKQLTFSHAFVVWDGGLSEERIKELPGYKAQRPEMPISLENQIPEIQKYLKAKGIAIWQAPGVEADDVIATVTRQFSEQIEIIIASPDKDFMQLVKNGVGIVNPHDKEMSIWNELQVLEKTGVTPYQVVDWLSLIGDSVDNIKGVDGIGPKTAAKLLNQYGDIDRIYQSIDDIPQSAWRDNLIKQREIVYRNRRLINLVSLPEKGWRLSEFSIGTPDNSKLADLFKDWGFQSMFREVTQKSLMQGELLI